MRRRRLLLLAAIITLTTPLACSADAFEGIERMFGRWGLFQGLEISGSNRLTLQEHALEGSQSAFEGQRWDTDSLVRRSSLHIEGPIWRNLGIQADISASGWGRSYTRYVMGWTTEETALYYGDLSIRLTGNEFANFSKTLSGWQLDQVLPGGGLLRGFYSREKGLTRTEAIEGNNTSGPFFLRYTPIIEGSEVVKVDEEVMRFGEDYRLDYETGQLRFEPVDGPPRIIPGTSVISISYQSYGWESTPGDLYGARAEMPLLDDRMLVGVTALIQDRRDPQDAGDTAGYQEEVFYGSGTTGPFDVNFRPILTNGSTVVYNGETQTIDQTVVVLVDNAEQVQGVDYDVYHSLGRIIFRRAIPATSMVTIRYYYDLGAPATSSDERVLGLDLGYRINDDLTFNADWARSQQAADSASGQAFRGSLAFARPDLTATLEMRDVSPDFSYIDTAGFQRRQKGLNFAAQWQPTDYISVYERYSNLKSDSSLSFGTGSSLTSTLSLDTAATDDTTSTLSVQTNRNDFGLDVRYPGWPQLSFTRQTLENTGGSTTGSRSTTDSLSLSYSPGDLPFSINAALTDTSQSYLSGGTDTSRSGSDTQQTRFSAQYTPSAELSLTGHFGTTQSSSRYSDGTRDDSDSEVAQLSARWTPSSRLSISLDHSITTSTGSRGSLYWTYGLRDRLSAWQIGSPGGGGGGDSDEDEEEDETSRYEDASTQLNVSYRPAKRLNLMFSAGTRDYLSGGGLGYLADSEQTFYNASANWSLGPELSITGTWGSDETMYLEEGRGAIVSDLLSLGVNYRPDEQPWGLSLNLNQQTGSSPTTIRYGDSQVTRNVPTDLFDISGRLTYDLAPGISLFGTLERADYSSGYSVYTKDTGELGLSYRMSNLADLSFSYRYIRNVTGDPNVPLPGAVTGSTAGQDYIAHSFMLGISSQFSSGLASSGRGGYSGYSGSMSSFGGYTAGTAGYGYGMDDSFGDFSGSRTYRRTGLTGYSGGTYGDSYVSSPFGGQTSGFSLGNRGLSRGTDLTRGSGASYEPSTGQGATFDTGLGEFEGRDSDDETARGPAPPFGEDGGMGPEPPGRRDGRRWWQWYE